MLEKYRYRGLTARFGGCEPSAWVYFTAYSDSDASTEFYRLTGCSSSHGIPVELQQWDDDFRLWMDVEQED